MKTAEAERTAALAVLFRMTPDQVRDMTLRDQEAMYKAIQSQQDTDIMDGGAQLFDE